MTYPATNLNEAVGLVVPDSNALHEVINGEATETVTLPEGGTVPTLRKAITDSLLFKDPIAWNEGTNETDLLQLRTFTDSLIYWAPTATVSNPIPMGATPVGDSNWKLAPLAISKEAIDQAEERAIGTGVSIYRGSNGSYVQNGDTIPIGTTHLAVLINGKVEDVTMSPITSGVVADLTETSATIGTVSTILSTIIVTNEYLILLTRGIFEQTGERFYVPAITVEFNQDYAYPIDHLYGDGKLNWNGIEFDIALASGKKSRKTLGYWTAKMNAGTTVRIGCIGDSTTDGTNTTGFVDNPYTTDADGKKYPTSDTNHSEVGGVNAWPTKMRTLLQDYHGNNNISVYNGGYGGQSLPVYTPSGESYKTSWPYRYFERIFFDNPNYDNPHIVFISFGLNGAVTTDVFRVDDMLAGLNLLIYKIRGYGGVPVLLTPDAVLGANPTNYQKKAREEFCPAFDKFAKENNVEFLDQWTASRKFWANNNIYKWRTSMTDGVHQNDYGHQFKAGFISKEMMGALVKLEQNMESIFPNEREFHPSLANNGQAASGNLRFGGFSVFDVNDRTQATAWVWCESADYDIVMRDFGINYSTPPTAQSELPSIIVSNSVGYDDGFYLSKINSYGGRKSFYDFPAENPNILGKLKYGLNKIDLIGPLGSNVSGAYLGYLQFIKDFKNSSRALFENQIGNQTEKFFQPPQLWLYNPSIEGVGKVYIPAEEDWINKNIVSWGNAGDVVDLYLEVNMSSDVGLPICDGQTDTGRSGLIVYQISGGYRMYEHRRLDSGAISFSDLGLVSSAFVSNTDNKFRIRFEASVDGLDQILSFYDDWDTNTATTVVQRSVARPSSGAYRASGVIGGLWTGNGEPSTTVKCEIKHCTIVKS